MTSKRGKSGYSLFISYNFDHMRDLLGQDAKPSQVITELAKVWNSLKSAGSRDVGKINKMFYPPQPIVGVNGNINGYIDRWFFDNAWYDREDQ